MRAGVYLQKHGQRWRFRARLGAAVSARTGLSFLVVSVRTGDHAEAVRRARAIRSRLDRMTTELSPTLKPMEARRRVRAIVDAEIEALETEALMRGGLKVLTPDETEKLGQREATELEALFGGVFLAFGHRRLQEKLAAKRAGMAVESNTDIDAMLEAYRPMFSDGLLPASPDAMLIDQLALSGLSEILEKRRALTAGEALDLSSPAHLAPAPEQPVSREISLNASMPFMTWWDEYTTAKINADDWKKGNLRDAGSTRRLFDQLYPGIKLGAVDRRLVSTFRTDFFRLPQKHAQQLPFKDLSPRDLLKLLEDEVWLAKHKIDLTTLRLKDAGTVDKYTSFLQGYWEHLGVHGVISDSAQNPFAGFGRSKKSKKKSREQRKAWSADQIKLLFTSPLFTGCKTTFRRSSPGTVIVRDAKFWVTLMGPHLGARLNEVCSLKVSDIVREGEVPVFQIREAKNEASERDPPIPPVALALGFLEYRFHGRKPEEPLFPELLPQGATGDRSISFSKWFGRYRRDIGVAEELVDFHSLRANFITEAVNKLGLNNAWIDEVTGHSNSERQSERSRYTKEIWADNKLKVVSAVDYDIDLSHLTYRGTKGIQAPEAALIIKAAVIRAERDKEVASKKNI
ncbi:MAG: site-specific integrase [Bosea sp.]|nr:site-specific integrase [Bosea sp. (in: a-proteobacteria)]